MIEDKKTISQLTNLYIVDATYTGNKQNLPRFDGHTLGLHSSLGQNGHQLLWFQKIDDL